MVQLVHYDPATGAITGTLRFIGTPEDEKEISERANTIVVDALPVAPKAVVDLKTKTIVESPNK